jgi:transcriptional regulator with XRE-family HTH domain
MASPGVTTVRPSIAVMLGEAIRNRRSEAGYSLETLAGRCNWHRTHLGAIERAERRASISDYERIARGLDMPLGLLVTEAEVLSDASPIEDFRQAGLVDADGRPLEESDARVHLLSGDLVVANDAVLRHLARHPEDMYRLTAREFEELVAETLSRHGYQVRLTPIARDGGKDMFVASHGALGSALYIVECKRFAPDRPVDVGIVRQLHGVVHAERLTGGILATTSYFTKPAQQFAAPIRYQLSLADFADVYAWIRAALNMSSAGGSEVAQILDNHLVSPKESRDERCPFVER